MFLQKYCKEEHNIARGCRTLRLGTLTEYREMDSSFDIADQWEGISQAGTGEEGVSFQGKELSDISGSIISSVGDSSGTVSLTGNIHLNLPNVFIFCASRNDQNESFSEYDSHYTIPNADKFAQELTRLFSKQLKLSDLEIKDLNVVDLTRLKVVCVHRDVTYLKKPFDLNEENKMKMMELMNNPVDSYFAKSDDKGRDAEYRFVLLPLIDNNIIPVKKDAKILNIAPFYDCMFDPDNPNEFAKLHE